MKAEQIAELPPIEVLENRLADLKARLPAHSVPPVMIIEMEDLEEQLAELRTSPERAARPAQGRNGL